jgi:hypothetical protein
MPSMARVTVLSTATVVVACESVLVDFPEQPAIKAAIMAIKIRFFILIYLDFKITDFNVSFISFRR